MHRHNLDLIAEYAEGTLANDAAARALVDTCEVCSAEYETQKALLVALSSLEPVTMTEQEKARLHRDVATELRSPKPEVTRGALWPRWAVGTAAAIVVIGLAGVLSQWGGSNAMTETFSEIGSSLDGGQDLSGEEATSGGDVGQDPLAPAAGEAYFYDESTGFASVAKSVREMTSRTSSDSTSGEDTECLEESGLVDYRIVPDVEKLTRLLVAVSTPSDNSMPKVAFIDPASCEVVHLED